MSLLSRRFEPVAPNATGEGWPGEARYSVERLTAGDRGAEQRRGT
jgi:hypothetical protein